MGYLQGFDDCEAALDVVNELRDAREKHGKMCSAHEGFAVLLEEVEELKAEVFKGGRKKRDTKAMRAEAVQVAAMAMRFIEDVCDG